jgi:hypothetical protein
MVKLRCIRHADILKRAYLYQVSDTDTFFCTTEILLKVALNTKNQSISQFFILNKPSLLNTGIGLGLWYLMIIGRYNID